MPIYEEKLISPLAVRFTQDYVRSTFRDGRDVEAALPEVEEQPGVGGYDVVLRPPFPAIEVIRWRPRRSHSEVMPADGSTGALPVEGEHWFTFDNRRLYCLQLAAAARWPRRAAVVVEVLYADTGDMRRKYDSTTSGRAVSLGHSLDILVGRWDWRDTVARPSADAYSAEERAAMSMAAADDAKSRVDQLLDPPCEPGPDGAKGLWALEEASTEALTPVGSHEGGSDASGPASVHATPRAATPPRLPSPPVQVMSVNVETSLEGEWQGEKGETYTIQPQGEATWICMRQDGYRSKRYTVVYDQELGFLWWGLQKTYFLDLADVRDMPDRARWYSASDRVKKRRPRFAWTRVAEAPDTTQASLCKPQTAAAADKAAEAPEASEKAPARPWAARRRSRWVPRSGGA
mmetsp:Transcript_28053/g.80899  ORF Transcript_28053/g.80899 Transcript_28053/m.80899 type:complete len:404 (+) Transcript_28053:121-1332(+)